MYGTRQGFPWFKSLYGTCFVFCFSFVGRGVIEASPLTEWEAVKNPLSRYIYDNMLKVRSFIMRTRDLRTTLHDSFNWLIGHRPSATDKRTLYLCGSSVYFESEYGFRIFWPATFPEPSLLAVDDQYRAVQKESLGTRYCVTSDNPVCSLGLKRGRTGTQPHSRTLIKSPQLARAVSKHFDPCACIARENPA